MSQPEVPSITRGLTQAGIDRYAAASGDHNPIHIDAEFAKTTPLGGTIAHGMLVLATIAEMMTAAFGEAWLGSGKLEVRFRAPARPGDTITASATPSGESNGNPSTGSGRSVRYKVECVNQAGELLISGTAEVATP